MNKRFSGLEVFWLTLIKRLSGLAVLLLVIMGGIWFFNEWNASAQDQKTPQPQPPAAATGVGVGIGQKLPEFTLPSPTKKEVTVKSAGRPVVINFFTTWCPPCRQEMPELDMFVKKYKTTLDFYAVNIQESPEAVMDFMDKNGYSFKDSVLFDESGEIARSFRVNAIPTTIIADKNGVIRHVKLGAVNLMQLEDFLEKLPKD